MASEPTENSVDIDMFSEIRGSSEVQSSSKIVNPEYAFVQKCLHPPSAVPGYCGLPTNDARSQVTLEWRTMNINNTPMIFDYKTGATRLVTASDLSQFDYTYLHTNGGRVLSIPFIWNTSTGGMTQDLANVALVTQYNWENWIDDANLFRIVYKSSTHSLNATMFNNTGTMVGNQFNPAILFAGTLLAFAESFPSHFRNWCRDMIKCRRLCEVDLSDRVVSTMWSQFPRYIRDSLTDTLSITKQLNLDPNTNIQVLNLSAINQGYNNDITPDNNGILQQSMRSYGGKALEGGFSIQRLNTITPRWQTATNTNSKGLRGLYECYTYSVDAGGAGHFVPLLDNQKAGTGSSDLVLLQDTLWSQDMTMSWVRFQGLSLNSQTSVSTQLLILKQYIGLEVQPTAISAWGGMTKLGPKPDLTAMQALMDGFFEIKDVLPARYNFWGTLGSIAAQGLKTFGSSILDNLVSGGGKSKGKKGKAGKEMGEVRDVDHKTDALNKKVDAMLARFNAVLGGRGGGGRNNNGGNQQPRKRSRTKSAPPRGRSRSVKPDRLPPNPNYWPANRGRDRRRSRSNTRRMVMPPGQVAQNTV